MATQCDLNKEAADGIEEAIAWHTVGIVADEPRGIGTGTAILWRTHHVILTAWHVIKDNPIAHLWFFFRPDGTLRRADPADMLRQGRLELTPRRHIEVRNHHYSDKDDLAILEVDAELERSSNLRFYDLEPDSLTPGVGTSLATIGYPHDITLQVSKEERVVSMSPEWSQRVKQRGKLKEFDPSGSFLAGYPSAAVGRHPGGFSGAGVWFHRSSPVVWRPNLGLAGVCTNYYRASRLLVIRKIERVIRFFEKTLPEELKMR